MRQGMIDGIKEIIRDRDGGVVTRAVLEAKTLRLIVNPTYTTTLLHARHQISTPAGPVSIWRYPPLLLL